MKSPAMQVLPTTFMILQSIGLWEPLRYNSLSTRFFYKFYTSIILLALGFHLITTLIGFILAERCLFEITNNGLRVLAVAVCYGKMLNLRIHRGAIIHIIETLNRAPCAPIDAEEIAIQDEHNRNVRNLTLRFALVANIVIFFLFSTVIRVDIPARKLPRKAWFPFDSSHGAMYWFACFLQTGAVAYHYLVMLGHDTLVSGLFLEISAKLIMLQHRLTHLHKKLNSQLIEYNYQLENILEAERILIIDCVTYHLCLLNLTERINSAFSLVNSLQYFFGSAMLCFSIYLVTVMDVKSSVVGYLLTYLSVLVYDIFIVCASANDITINSGNLVQSVFAMDWLNFRQETLRSLMIIGCRSSRPIVLTVGYFLTLSLDAFKSLIKVSFSAYNALKSLH